MPILAIVVFFTPVHYWGAFWTVVSLGIIQILVAYYNTHLTIASLPPDVSRSRRTRYRIVFVSLMLGITLLTLLLAKFNDMHQYQASLDVQAEHLKQEALQKRLDETLNAITSSQTELNLIRDAVVTHQLDRTMNPAMPDMLHSLDQVQRHLAHPTQ